MRANADLAAEARERKLAREEDEAAQRQVDTERLYKKTQAEVDVLGPRAEALRQTVAEYKDEIATLRDHLADNWKIDADLQQQLAEGRRKLAAIEKRIVDAAFNARAKRDTFDAELAAHAATATKNADDALKEKKVALYEAHKDLQLATKRLEAVKTDIGIAERFGHDTQNSLDILKDEIAKETIEIKAKLRSLKDDYQRRFGENQQLLTLQTELKKENIQLEAENKEFKAYEKRALMALANADQALREREAIVEQREQYKPAARSFLPPHIE